MGGEKEGIIGQYLYFEGVHYNEMRDGAVLVGTYLSFFLHSPCRIISIHFREGLDRLKKLEDQPIKLMKEFLQGLETDLNKLASRLRDDSRLAEIEEIWGLCSLSAKWGERHGFKTYQLTSDSELVSAHDLTINEAPKFSESAIFQPLTLFYHTRESFIKEFGEFKL